MLTYINQNNLAPEYLGHCWKATALICASLGLFSSLSQKLISLNNRIKCTYINQLTMEKDTEGKKKKSTIGTERSFILLSDLKLTKKRKHVSWMNKYSENVIGIGIRGEMFSILGQSNRLVAWLPTETLSREKRL